MTQSVIINLGQGDFNTGFPTVTAQLWTENTPFREQFIGSLPPAPHIINLYQRWQSLYHKFCNHGQLLWGCRLVAKKGSITNVSVENFDDLCEQLKASINEWLTAEGFFTIDRQLRTRLDTSQEVRVIIESNDKLIRRLPWHCCNFFKDYPFAEIGFSQLEYQRLSSLRNKPEFKRDKIRILAILGDREGIDSQAEVQLLKKLEDAEVKFVENPSRHELDELLWDSVGWDILFFVGHSETDGETGIFYINENDTNNSVTPEKLEEALKAAIDNGLRLAIFNSCDGLGLANALEKLHIPTVIVMREPVPNIVAEEFFLHFMDAFAVRQFSLYLSLQQARRKLQRLEDYCPGVSWLPAICVNPAAELPSWTTTCHCSQLSLPPTVIAFTKCSLLGNGGTTKQSQHFSAIAT
ncbi:MAG: CHAT domain-containing protein [Scytonematopsis contorta HA4267-MV1]|nr:CHAT domain-containing protein [Scytonematopsis contorta HA4267-MV1]